MVAAVGVTQQKARHSVGSFSWQGEGDEEREGDAHSLFPVFY